MAVFKKPVGNLFKENARLSLNDGVEFEKLAKDKYCKSILVSGSGCLFDKEGELIEDNSLKSSQKGKLHLGELTSNKYHILLEPNPEFISLCSVKGPRLLEPYERINLNYFLKADYPICLNDFDYLFRLYIVD